MKERIAKLFSKIKNLATGRKKLAILALLIVGGAALTYWKMSGNSQSDFLTEKVAYGDVQQTINCTGIIQPIESVQVSFKNSGMIKKIYVKAGDKVKAGQILAEQDADDLQTQLTQSEASLESAQANLAKTKQGARPEEIDRARSQVSEAKANMDQAGRDLERIKTLYKSEAETLSNLEQSQTTYEINKERYAEAQSNLQQLENGNLPEDIQSAAAQVKNATVQVQKAQNDIQKTKISSPVNGYVALVNGSADQWSQGGAPPANSSTSSNSMVYVNVVSKELELSCQVNEADVSNLAVGQEATYTVNAYPDKVFHAKIKSIAPQAITVSNVQMFSVIFSTEQDASLKAGMNVNINIIKASRKHVLVMPLTALNFAQQSGVVGGAKGGARGDTGTAETKTTDSTEVPSSGIKNRVIILNNGKQELVKVTTGLKDGINVEVTDGLKEGDEVIIGSMALTTKDKADTSAGLGIGAPQSGRGGKGGK